MKMPKEEDAAKALPIWARLRLAHDFAEVDEKKQLEKLADEIIAKHPDIQKILTNQEFTGQMVPGLYSRFPPGCNFHMMPCIYNWTV